MNIQILRELYQRRFVERDTNNLYIFTENCELTSGNNLIQFSGNPVVDQLYAGKRFPNMSQAVIRGLGNALPITTKKGQYSGQFFTDLPRDFALFTSIVDADIARIVSESTKYKLIFFSSGGFATDKASLPYRHVRYLQLKLEEAFRLQTDIVNSSAVGFGLSNLRLR